MVNGTNCDLCDLWEIKGESICTNYENNLVHVIKNMHTNIKSQSRRLLIYIVSRGISYNRQCLQKETLQIFL